MDLNILTTILNYTLAAWAFGLVGFVIGLMFGIFRDECWYCGHTIWGKSIKLFDKYDREGDKHYCTYHKNCYKKKIQNQVITV